MQNIKRDLQLKVQYWGWRQGRKFRAEVHDLMYIFWEATMRCNLNCLHCGSDCMKESETPDLSGEKVVEVFRDIASHYDATRIMVAVTGGEPLVREDLFDVTSQISRMGFPWGMVTNGMLVTEETAAKCIDAGMRTVSVSVDGLKDTHNWLRNNPVSYDRAMNALRIFLKTGRLSTVEAITCVNGKNIDQLEEMYEVFKKVGINGWRLFSIFPKGRADVNRELILNRSLLQKLFAFIGNIRKSNPAFYVSYSEEGFLGCDIENKVRDNFFYCGAGINIAGLLADGSFTACPSLSREWIQGHVDEVQFSQAWETRYTNMRKRNWMKTGNCVKCRQWKNCGGSSLHLWDWEKNETKVCHYELLHGDGL